MSTKRKQKSFSSFVNNPFDFPLLITILILLAVGLIMVLSASSPSSLAESGDSYAYFSRQLIFGILGVVAMFFISKIDYRWLKKFYKASFAISCALLLLVLFIGEEINGATRWIQITESFSFQPSEVVKIFMIIFYAGLLTENREKLREIKNGFLMSLFWLIPIAAFLLLQPHLSATIVIVCTAVVMMLVAGARIKHFIVSAFLAVPLLIAAIVAEPYRLERLITFLDPWQDPSDTGYQVIQSLYAIGSGGLFGVGLGESKQKFLYIPEPHNDFIFSILAEELGFLGCIAVIALFAIFIWRGIVIAMKAPDMFGSLIAIGITSLVAIQVIINIAVVTSSMPATGMPLPFFSYGGTALLILMGSMGILLNISRASAKS